MDTSYCVGVDICALCALCVFACVCLCVCVFIYVPALFLRFNYQPFISKFQLPVFRF
jgi:hypothetical protein